MLPTFLIIGSQKAGTTSLHRVLSSHPQIFMPEKKELRFFSQPGEFGKGTSHYEEFFLQASDNHIAVGEASPGYICHPDAPGRIRDLIPDARLILTVRNPIDRAYSQYWDNRRHLTEWLPFRKAVELWLKEEFIPGERGYFSRGNYILYIERYLELFPRENLLILLFDDLVRDPSGFYRNCCSFLGVDPDGIPQEPGSSNRSYVFANPVYSLFLRHCSLNRRMPAILRRAICSGRRIGFDYPPMSSDAMNCLRDFYRPLNDRLFELIGRDQDVW